MSEIDDNKIIEQLKEEHKDDFATDEASTNDEGNDAGGDKGSDQSTDEATGDSGSNKDGDAESTDTENTKTGGETETGEDGSTESDDSDQSGTEQVGEKKDANSRIRQLLEEKKAIEAEKLEIQKKLAEREEAERKIADLVDDPVYKLDDFIGTAGDDGEVLTDGEAKARFMAWEADYKLRQFQKQQVMKETQDTLIKMQSETKEAFAKFPEFDQYSDKYDAELAGIANDAFRAGLIYQTGHDGDDQYIIGSRVHPGELLEKLHKLRAVNPPVTKVNNLGDDTGTIVSSQQVNKKTDKYAPGFRGEVDKELDKLINKGNK